MYESRAKQKLKARKPVLGIVLNFVNADSAEFLGLLGYDIIIIDGEQAALVDSDVKEIARACDLTGATPILRTHPDPALLERYVSLGIRGFHLPRIHNAEDVRRILEPVMFPPVGNRALGVFRSGRYGMPEGGWDQFMAQSNANMFIKVILEDREGLAALPELAKIPELDVIMLGTSDLATSLGFAGQRDHPEVIKALDESSTAIKNSGKVLGIRIANGDEIKAAYARGARYYITSFAVTAMVGISNFLDTMKELQ